MYKIILFGTGVTAGDVLRRLKKNCEVVCYIDNNSAMWGKHNGIEVKSPAEINCLSYDYIIIASQYNEEIYNQLISLGVDKEKILQYFKVIDGEYNYINDAMDNFRNSEIEYEMIATGISYCRYGLMEDIMKPPCYKFAFGSQDLYYDYNIVKYILKNYKEKCKKLKYCLIGLCYYSFEYDLSLSSMKNKTSLYYEVLGLLHNNKEIESFGEEYYNSKRIADLIFRVGEDGKYVYGIDEKIDVACYNSKEELGKIQAERDCNKNYPKTVNENIIIFEKYIKMLIKNNIIPLIVVFPTSKYYYNNFSDRIEKEYNNIIKSMRSKYKFLYLDYFKCELFNDDKYFWDISHLNELGAKKITGMINNELILYDRKIRIYD